jgi:hypothetical protein
VHQGCAAKTWATAPPLKTVVLIGFTVSGARKTPLTRAQNDRLDDKPSTADQSGVDQRTNEPYPAVHEQIALGALPLEPRAGLGQVSGDDRRPGPGSAEAIEFESTTLGVPFIDLAKGSDALAQQ